MNEPILICPRCQNEIRLTESLAAPLIEAERRRLESAWEERRTALEREAQTQSHALREAQSKLAAQAEQQRLADAQLAQRRRELEQAAAGLAEQVEAQVRQRLIAEREPLRAALRAEEARRAAEEQAAQLAALREQAAAQAARLKAAEENELNLRRVRTQLEQEKQTLELTVARQMDEERAAIRAATLKEAADEQRLRDLEREQTMAGLRSQIEELRHKAETRSQQLQGEVLELDLEARLREAYSRDRIEPVPKGQFGGDVLQTVIDAYGRECGVILWESKRTKRWSAEWLRKLRDDQRAARADVAALISTVLPEGVEPFAQLDGVWVGGPGCAVPLAAALRHGLILAAQAHAAMQGRSEKQELVYRYLIGGEFRARVSALAETYIGLRDELEKERNAFLRQWSKRAKQLERFAGGLLGMYGDVQGIVGQSLPQLRGLELPLLSDVSATEDPEA